MALGGSPYPAGLSTASPAENLIIEIMGDAVNYLDAIARSNVATRNLTYELLRQGDAAARLSTRVNDYTYSMGRYAHFASSMLAELGITLGFVGTLAKSISLGAEAESMQIQFGVMLRNAEMGRTMYMDLRRLAAETPLEMPDVTHATRTLLQHGVQARDVITTLRQLGDVAGGENERFQRLALAYGQVLVAGRLMGQENRQMINAGFNPLHEIARTTGRSMAALNDDMRRGTISVEMLRDAFTSATGPGGQFHGMMIQMSQTVSGLWSTLRDNVINALTDIGMELSNTMNIRGWIRSMSSAVAEAKAIWDMIPAEWKKIAIGAAGLVVSLTAIVLVMFTLVSAWRMAAGILNILAPAFLWLTSSMNAAALAVTGLQIAMAAFMAVGLYRFFTWLTGARAANRELNRELERSAVLSNRMASAFSGRAAGTLQGIQEVSDPTERRRLLDVELASAEQYMNDINARTAAARRRVESTPTNPILEAMGRRNLDMEAAQDNYNALSAQARAAAQAVNAIRDALHDVEPGTMQQRLTEDISKLNDELRKEVELFGLSSEQKKIYELSVRGASAADLESLRLLERRHRAEQVTKQFEDPVDKFARRAAELQDLLNMGEAGGGISQGTFNRAMQQAEDELAKVADQAARAHHEIHKLDATMAGSAEHMTRMEKYRDMLDDVLPTHDRHGGRHRETRTADEMIAAGYAAVAGVTASVVNTPWGVNWQNPSLQGQMGSLGDMVATGGGTWWGNIPGGGPWTQQMQTPEQSAAMVGGQMTAIVSVLTLIYNLFHNNPPVVIEDANLNE